jgi:stage II sporulation protein D
VIVRSLAVGAACLAIPGQPAPVPTAQQGIRAPREIRVVLASLADEAPVGGTIPWKLTDAWGRTHASGTVAGTWLVERRGMRLRAVSADRARETAWTDAAFAQLPATPTDPVTWNGRRYRGELQFVATDTAILVLNVLPIEEYLRGVVPLEIGPRTAIESAAIEAQAVAARSYAIVRALEGVTRSHDIIAGTLDQVYGGIDAELASSDVAIRASARQVLTYGGRVVRAPYSSTCGGTTAAPAEVWVGSGEPWLRRVSDVDSTGRPWCAASPRFTWERSFDVPALSGAIARHLRRTRVPVIQSVRAESTTASGRVGMLALDAAGETIRLRGNDMRFALRDASGAILNSTYFSVATAADGKIIFRGRGNGHGVGMCQWGAIGRARAGHDARRILAAYFPGTSLTTLQ